MKKNKILIVVFLLMYIFVYGYSSLYAYEISATTNKNLILDIVQKKNNTLNKFKSKGIKYVKTLDLFVENYKEDESVLNILGTRINSIYANKNQSVKILLDYLLRRVNFSLYNIEVKKNNLNTNTSSGTTKKDNNIFTPNLGGGGGGGGGGSSSSNTGGASGNSSGNSTSITTPITSSGSTSQTGIIDNTGTTQTPITSSGSTSQTGVIDNTGAIINTGEINIGNNPSIGWGFKDFIHPSNIVNVSASGGELRTKIIGGNKILKLSSGIYYLNRLNIPSNTILEGVGKGKTILKAFGTGYVLSVASGSNVIVNNLTIDATGNGDENGFEITNGSDNILIDNVDIFGATKSNLIVWNEIGSYTGANLLADPSENITFRNIKSYGAIKYHGIALKFAKGREILNSEIYGCGGYGFDISSSSIVNIGGNYVHNTMGTKYPASDYLYIHDNNISNNNIDSGPGLKIQRECGSAGHLDIENNKILNNNVAVRDWTYNCSDLRPHFEEVVFKNNEIAGPDGGLVTVYYANKLEVYGINGTLKSNHSADGDPYIDGVGYKTWFTDILLKRTNIVGFTDFNVSNVYTPLLTRESIQNAIDLASANSGGIVKIPAGKVIYGGLGILLKDNVKIEGTTSSTGELLTTLVYTGASNKYGDKSVIAIGGIGKIKNVSIKNLIIDKTQATRTPGNLLDNSNSRVGIACILGCNNVLVEGNHIIGDKGYYQAISNVLKTEGSIKYDELRNGISFWNAGGEGAGNITIRNNLIEYGGGHSIETRYLTGALIYNNTIKGAVSGHDISSYSNSVEFFNNKLNTGIRGGKSINASNIYYHNNSFNNFEIVGLYLQGINENITIKDNDLTGNKDPFKLWHISTKNLIFQNNSPAADMITGDYTAN